MKKIVIATCIVALSLSVFGQDYANKIKGTWKLSSILMDGEKKSAEDFGFDASMEITDTQLVIEMNGEVETSNYTLVGNMINEEGAELGSEIIDCSSKVLILKTPTEDDDGNIVYLIMEFARME